MSSLSNKGLHARLEHDPLLQMATEWVFELRSRDVSSKRIAEWQQWLAADAAHRQAFEKIESLWQLGGQLSGVKWPSDAEVKADRYRGSESVAEWRERASTSSVARIAAAVKNAFTVQPAKVLSPLFSRPVLAAGLTVSAVALGWALSHSELPLLWSSGTQVETLVGETRNFVLADGSRISAGGHTELRVKFTANSREITLRSGEAFFQVATDRNRPFTVRAGDTAVMVLGTAFNVRRSGERVVVAVAEGAVRVGKTPLLGLLPHSKQTSDLTAGQQLNVERSTMTPLPSVNISAIAGWREGRLQYLNEPLEEVIEDIARYSDRKIEVTDGDAKQLRVTGIVFQQNIEGWLTSLQATFALRVTRGPDGLTRIASSDSP